MSNARILRRSIDASRAPVRHVPSARRALLVLIAFAAGCGDESGGSEPKPDGGRADEDGGSDERDGGRDASGSDASNPVVYPDAVPKTCLGSGCPLGECDDEGFFADVKCSDVYKKPFDSTYMFCATSSSSDYCGTFGDRATSNEETFVVHCKDGAATLERCFDGGCGASSGDSYKCL